MEFDSDTGLVARFGAWANSHGVERFWGVGRTGSRLCLVLPTMSPEWRSIIVEDSGTLWLIDGYASEPLSNEQFAVGDADVDSPGHTLVLAANCCVHSGQEMLCDGKGSTCVQKAHVAERIAYYLNDSALLDRARALKETALLS